MGDLVFLAIVAARFVVPLFIPRFPLPAIILALIIDAADQTIFAAFGVEPPNYQGYDKALDIFYLSVAYLSTIRNWPNTFAYRVAQFLWYYRLIGVLLFEFTEVRALLLIFPNTFEYFFIAYEFVRVAWNPSRLTHRNVLGMAAAIWIFIKLPQEAWIHIFKLDFTEALNNHAWLGPLIVIVLIAAAAAIWLNRKRIPAPDWRPSFDVAAHPTTVLTEPVARGDNYSLLDHPLFEKSVLIALVGIIFSLILPGYNGTTTGLAIGVGIIIVANSFISDRLFGGDARWSTTLSEFVANLAVNAAVLLGAAWVLNIDFESSVAAFYALLISLMGALYDHFRRLRLYAIN